MDAKDAKATASSTSNATCPQCGMKRSGRKICLNCGNYFYDDVGPDRPPEFKSYIPAFFWALVAAALLVMAGPVFLFSSAPTATRPGVHRRGGSSVGLMIGGVMAGGALLGVAFRYRRQNQDN